MTEGEFQEFLDAISACFITQDFEAWASRITLPFSLITKTGSVYLNDRDALRANFEQYLVACAVMGLDHIYREPLGLEDCGDGFWIGTYKTHLMSQNLRPTQPYVSSAMLEQRDGWITMSSIIGARGHMDWTEEG